MGEHEVLLSHYPAYCGESGRFCLFPSHKIPCTYGDLSLTSAKTVEGILHERLAFGAPWH